MAKKRSLGGVGQNSGEWNIDKGDLLLSLAAGVGVLVISAATGDLPLIDQTVLGQTLDLMSGQMGTP